ncbi:hypothetical protein AB0L40_19265 [Patulibacter sp. NPDC049589]|uniref:hypothetical protein n=1 Tax=Patulibacter sp. NPDC049589 TaxID=3154731 RepID=UPI00343C16EF
MRSPFASPGVPAVLASLLVVAVAAPAAHAERAVPAGAGIAGAVDAVSPDGTLVTTESAADRSTLGVATLGGSGAFTGIRSFGQDGSGIALTATAADGSAVFLTPDGDNSALAISTRPAGGSFGAFAPFGTGNSASSIATAGGVVLAGSDVQVTLPGGGYATQPIVLRRAADGTLAPPIVLPGGPNVQNTDPNVQVGVDASGRGVVAWTRRTDDTSRVVVATVAADGTVGAPTELPGASKAANVTGLQAVVRVAADGRGAVAWKTGDTVSVVPVTTSGAPDLARAASVKLHAAVIQLQADGAALASVTRAKGGRSLYVTSRAAGKPFTAVQRVRGVRGNFESSALSGGTWVTTQRGGGDGYPSASTASVVHGRAGGPPSKVVAVPVGAATTVDLQAAAPGGSPLVLASASRSVFARRDDDGSRSSTTQAFRPVTGGKIAARTSIRMAKRQRLGGAGAVRMTIRCSSACSYRVRSSLLKDGKGAGEFDSSRTMKRGTRSVSIPYGGTATSQTSPLRPLRRAQRVRFAIAVDDARGGETVVHRVVDVRP